MATSLPTLFTTFLLLLFYSTVTTSNSTTTTTTTKTTTTTDNLTSIHYSICSSTPHPSACLHSLTNSTFLSLPLPPSLLSFAVHSLHAALAAISNLTPLFSSTLVPQLTTSHLSAVEDCLELHAITLASLSRSSSLLISRDNNNNIANKLPTIRTHLSAALTNKATCLDGLSGAQGPLLWSFLSSFTSAYELVTNTLSLVAKLSSHLGSATGGGQQYKVPKWVPPSNRRLLQDDDGNNGGVGEQYDPEPVITVAKDGTGNFTTIREAVAFAPNNSDTRTIILVRAGTYEENVEVPFYKSNVVLLGEGSDVTVITGNRSAGDGSWTTFRSATVGTYITSR